MEIWSFTILITFMIKLLKRKITKLCQSFARAPQSPVDDQWRDRGDLPTTGRFQKTQQNYTLYLPNEVFLDHCCFKTVFLTSKLIQLLRWNSCEMGFCVKILSLLSSQTRTSSWYFINCASITLNIDENAIRIAETTRNRLVSWVYFIIVSL